VREIDLIDLWDGVQYWERGRRLMFMHLIHVSIIESIGCQTFQEVRGEANRWTFPAELAVRLSCW
jgi:hypothetical protein